MRTVVVVVLTEPPQRYRAAPIVLGNNIAAAVFSGVGSDGVGGGVGGATPRTCGSDENSSNRIVIVAGTNRRMNQ